MVTDYLPLAAPAVLFYAATVARRQPGRRPAHVLRIAERATLLALAVSLVTAALLLLNGTSTSAILGIGEVGLSSQRDAVSVILLTLVSFIGWVVVRYSSTYLDGASRQGAFIGWMSGTLGAVLLLVQAGNLWHFVGAWLAVSVCLHQLLRFYPTRIATLRAARKAAMMSAISDSALVAAAVLLFIAYDTSDISTLLVLASDGLAPPLMPWATALLALSAVVNSA